MSLAKNFDIVTKVRHSKAIWAAVEANDKSALHKLLVDEGADPNFKMKGKIPLELAWCSRFYKCARMLIENGANATRHEIVATYAALGALPELEVVVAASEASCDKGEIAEVLTDATFNAAANGHPAACEMLLARSVDVNACVDQTSLLSKASARGHLSVVRLLLQHKANTEAKNNKGNAALHYACAFETGHDHVAYELVAAGADVHARNDEGYTPLHHAASSGNAACVRLLLGKGADVNARTGIDATPLHVAAVLGRTEAAEALLHGGADVNAVDNEGRTALFRAADKGHGAVVKALLKHKANTEVKKTETGATALHQACCMGHTMVVAALLTAKASTSIKDNKGNIPLHYATQAKTDGDRCVMLLMRRGQPGDIEARDKDGHTPLHMAATVGNSTTAEALLDAGADVNGRDNNRVTPLMHAAIPGHLAVVELLIARKADVHVEARRGETALAAATRKGHPAVAEALKKAGAKR